MAYISTEDVKKIRVALKKEFGKKLKFSVRRVGHHSVDVTIKSGELNFFDIMGTPGRPVLINHYRLDSFGEHKPLFEKIVKIIKTAPDNKWRNHSDLVIDHFFMSFYFYIKINYGRI